MHEKLVQFRYLAEAPPHEYILRHCFPSEFPQVHYFQQQLWIHKLKLQKNGKPKHIHEGLVGQFPWKASHSPCKVLFKQSPVRLVSSGCWQTGTWQLASNPDTTPAATPAQRVVVPLMTSPHWADIPPGKRANSKQTRDANICLLLTEQTLVTELYAYVPNGTTQPQSVFEWGFTETVLGWRCSTDSFPQDVQDCTSLDKMRRHPYTHYPLFYLARGCKMTTAPTISFNPAPGVARNVHLLIPRTKVN